VKNYGIKELIVSNHNMKEHGVYMQLPLGLPYSPHQVCRRHALYGLKQAPLA